ncbi:MAG: hypothetical protein K8S99_15230 [Planctomycetes bacterium]|nr:hypothetical protein [Planctomycetota bacterium]
MQWTVHTWAEFQRCWDGVHNFMMDGECVPFAFDFPPIDRIVDELRKDEQASIHAGRKGDTLEREAIAESFRKLPIDRAVASCFGMAHYALGRFDKPGGLLHGLEKRVLDPWRDALKQHGFTFERCYPIIFISGPGCATNYHMDFSNVLAWQIYGAKRFCGLRSPGRWAGHDARIHYKAYELARPAEQTDDDALCYDMKPGGVLWNIILTPHWVEATDGIAMSLNLSHGGLRFNGRLCPFERDLEDFRAAQPEAAPAKFAGKY